MIKIKGVSTIVATILMLAITIALAGTAWVYFSGIAGRATQGISILDTSCATDGRVNITIRNEGTSAISTGGIIVTQTAPIGDTATPATCCSSIIDAGAVGTYSEACSGAGSRSCVYRLIPPGGAATVAPVPCS